MKSKEMKITESNYLKADDKIWKDYDARALKIDKLKSTNKDSIRQLYKILIEKSDKQNIETAIKYANTKSGFKRIYMLRNEIDKSVLLKTYNGIQKALRDSKYGKSIKSFIESKQVTKGSKFYDFKVVNLEGENLLLSNLIKRKNILLIYGGLKCIRAEGRKRLEELYNNTRNSNLEFIVFEPSADLSDLKIQAKKFKSNYVFISDFLLDHSPMKINYAVQTLPTSFLIDENGIIIKATEGIPDKEIKKLFIKK
jgi:glutathione peroxidase-family protein